MQALERVFETAKEKSLRVVMPEIEDLVFSVQHSGLKQRVWRGWLDCQSQRLR